MLVLRRGRRRRLGGDPGRARARRAWSRRSARGEARALPELGAEEAYVYDELPEDLRADVVLDPVGGDLFAAALARLRPLGTLVAIGYAAGLWPELEPGQPRRPQRRRPRLLPRPARAARPRARERVRRRAARALGARRRAAVVGAELPLAEVEQAHELVESRRSVGKVVLVP